MTRTISSHIMRRIVTQCKSSRCKESGVQCKCRYKILSCEASRLASVFVEGEHTMLEPSTDSPKAAKPTDPMIEFLEERLSEDAALTAVDLFGWLVKKVDSNIMAGPSPLLSQVQEHVKKWRKRNKRETMQPVIDICASCMYDGADTVADSGNKLLVLCDTKLEGSELVPDLGRGSKVSPFRIGLTCFSLLDTYVTIQRDPRCTTLFHIDSTHSIVRQRYPVFVFGISDCCGKFFPLVYFCTSQRIGTDINWCCAFVKRVVWETFMVQFSPKFIMTDADNAQYNACSLHFPGSKILMCWFHVCQNVKARIDGAKLDPVTRNMIFRGLNDMHYARDEEEFQTKRALVLAEWNAASAFSAPFRAVAEHIIAQWILHPRFSQWQAYHTLPGCATTNNPLEQYHRTLKLVNKSSKATPTEMVERLDRSRLVFANMQASFSITPVVSERLKALYNLTVRKKELKATPLLAAGDLPAQLVQVRHRPRSQYGDPPSLESDDFYVEDARQNRMPYKSIHVRRMQWQGMPDDGWLVNGRSRTCACRFNAKFAICIHVIHYTRELELHCPGMPDPVPIFVSNQRSRGSGTTRRSREQRSSPRNTASNLPTIQGTNTDTAPSNPEAAVDGPTYGPQRQPPTHAATQHAVAYDDVAVQGPQPRCLSQSFSSNISMTRESNQFTDESTNAEGLVANAYLSPHQACSPRFDSATHPGGHPSPDIAFAPTTPTTHTATPVATSELPVHVSSRACDTSVHEMDSSDAYYATARLITAQHIAEATRLVSYSDDNESSVTQEPRTLRRSCAQTKRRRV